MYVCYIHDFRNTSSKRSRATTHKTTSEEGGLKIQPHHEAHTSNENPIFDLEHGEKNKEKLFTGRRSDDVTGTQI